MVEVNRPGFFRRPGYVTPRPYYLAHLSSRVPYSPLESSQSWRYNGDAGVA